MVLKEHVAAIRDALEDVEKQHKQTGKALAKLHKRLQTALEQAGPECGLLTSDIVAFGGGTPKTPDPENP